MKNLVAIVFTGALIVIATPAGAQRTDSPTHDMPGMQHEAELADVQGVGVVKAIDAARSTVTLQHEAIAAIGWPAMTMPFKVASPTLLEHVKAGDRVRFTLHQAGMGGTVTSLEPARGE
jgi:Cu(I)/Ag(I) efflux system protein CusF